MEKIDNIVLLDTDAFIDYVNGSNMDLSIDIFSTSQAFSAPVTISVFTLYELLKNKDEHQVYEMLSNINQILGGMMHVKGVADELLAKTDPSFWINGNEFNYTEFDKFYKALILDVMKPISKYLTRYFFFVIYCALIFEAFEKKKDVRTLNFFISIGSNEEIIKEIDKLVCNLITTDDFINLSDSEKYKQLYNLLIFFFKSLNSLFDESIEVRPIQLITRSRIIKIMKLIRNANTPELKEIRKLVDTSSYDKFLESIFYKVYNPNLIKSLEDYMIKHVIMRVPYNNGRFELNDWIDILNLSFVANTKDAYVIYVTKENQWRNFIEDYRSIFPILEQCRIIGDEGYLDKKYKN